MQSHSTPRIGACTAKCQIRVGFLLGTILGTGLLAGCASERAPSAPGVLPGATAESASRAHAAGAPRKLLAVADFDGPDFQGDVETFPLKGNGNIAPNAILSGTNTGIQNPGSVGIDATGRVYELTPQFEQQESISVFAPGANGNVPPEGTFTDAAPGHFPIGIAADSAGYVYTLYSSGSGPAGIDVFQPGASGPTQPLRTITGPKTLLGTSTVDQFLVDANGGTWWQSDGEVGTNQIVGYAPGASGNVAPSRQFSGKLAFPQPIFSFAVDPAGRVYADASGTVYVFGPRQSGNVPPRRTFQPDQCDCYLRMFDSGLLYYVAIAYKGQTGVIAFDASATGHVSPSLNMTGPNTRLTQPSGLGGQ